MQVSNSAIKHEFTEFYKNHINSLAKKNNPYFTEYIRHIRQNFEALKNNGSIYFSEKTIEVKNLDFESLNTFFQFAKEVVKKRIDSLSFNESNSLLEIIKDVQPLFSAYSPYSSTQKTLARETINKISEINNNFGDILEILRKKLIDCRVDAFFDEAKQEKVKKKLLFKLESFLALSYSLLLSSPFSNFLFLVAWKIPLPIVLLIDASILILVLISSILYKKKINELEKKFKCVVEHNKQKFKDYLKNLTINDITLKESTKIDSVLLLYNQFLEENKKEEERQRIIKILENK